MLISAACFGGDDHSSTTLPIEADGQVIATSREHLREQGSYEVRFKIIEQTLESTYTMDGLAGYEAGQLSYGKMSLAGGTGENNDVDELLYVPEDMYFHTHDGRWFVESPWSQGTRPEDIPAGGLGSYLLNYDEITGAMKKIELIPDDPDEGPVPIHLVASADLLDLAAAHSAIEPLKDADGNAKVELWISSDTQLPFALEVRTDIKVRNARLVTTAQYQFVSYNQPIEIPERPAETRPYRDLQFPDAGCTGDAFAACLEPQSYLEGTANSCEGPGRRLCLVPLGQISPALITHLVDYYRAQYGLAVTVISPLAVPADFADPQRQQVDDDALTAYMDESLPGSYNDPQAVLIGLTPIDLYAKSTHFSYVFGSKRTYADPRGIISTFRMAPDFYGEPPDDDLAYSRTRKLLTKYIGLLYYGLPENADPTSPMYNLIRGPSDLDKITEPLTLR